MNERGTPRNLKPFKKGQSGNPRGRPPSPWRAWPSGVEPNARETPQRLLANGRIKPETRGWIAQDILDRMHGRPKQEIEGLFGSEGMVVIV